MSSQCFEWIKNAEYLFSVLSFKLYLIKNILICSFIFSAVLCTWSLHLLIAEIYVRCSRLILQTIWCQFVDVLHLGSSLPPGRVAASFFFLRMTGSWLRPSVNLKLRCFSDLIPYRLMIQGWQKLNEETYFEQKLICKKTENVNLIPHLVFFFFLLNAAIIKWKPCWACFRIWFSWLGKAWNIQPFSVSC